MIDAAYYEHLYTAAVREILDEYERIAGRAPGPDVLLIADLAGDQAIKYSPEWVLEEDGRYGLYFNQMRFEYEIPN